MSATVRYKRKSSHHYPQQSCDLGYWRRQKLLILRIKLAVISHVLATIYLNERDDHGKQGSKQIKVIYIYKEIAVATVPTNHVNRDTYKS